MKKIKFNWGRWLTLLTVTLFGLLALPMPMRPALITKP